MVTHNRIMGMLGERRRELLDQLDAIDKAIAALNGTGGAVAKTPSVEPDAPVESPASEVIPKRVASRRRLSDSHKHALVTGRRKAREAKDIAEGVAREKPGDSFVPAIRLPGDQPPRLVKPRGEK